MNYDANVGNAPYLDKWVSYLVQIYMNSIGITVAPTYNGYWGKGKYLQPEWGRRRNFAVWLVWFPWGLNQFVCVVLLMNFLVSYVGEIYGRVTES